MTAAPPAIASWTKPSDIYTLTVKKGGTTYGLEGGFVFFEYFESIFSPIVTGNLSFIDTGYGTNQGTITNALQISGNEEVAILINHPSGSLDFDDTTQHFRVSRIHDLGTNDQAKLTGYSLVSKHEKKNKITSVDGAYKNNIRNSLQDILTNKLGVPISKLNLENTQNSLNFKGSGRTPFDIALFLAPRSRPVKGAAGFVFYETASGLNFRAVNSLIKTTPVGHYTSKGVSAGGENQHSSCRIIKHVFIKKLDISEMENSGQFRNRTSYFNPITQQITTDSFDYGTIVDFDNLGSETSWEQSFNLKSSFSGDILLDYNKDLDNIPTFYKFFDPGNNASAPFQSVFDSNQTVSAECNKVIQELNNDPRLYQAMSIMRYQSLFSEIVDIVIPCNLFLRAGHVIYCEFPKHSGTITSASPNDEWESGKYLIMHLSHKFNQHGDTGSLTHLRVVRDTRGMYT